MKKEMTFVLNEEEIRISVNPSLPLLDFIRKEQHLHGTKEVCKEGDCGACTVLIGELVNKKVTYKTITSCIYPIGNVNGKHIVTIEGLNPDLFNSPHHEENSLNLQQEFFVEEGASQCGFCTPGFIISLTSYLLNNERHNFDDAIKSMEGNICRCTGYNSIMRSVTKILSDLNSDTNQNYINQLISHNVIPQYFASIPEKLKKLKISYLAENSNSDIFIAGGSDLFVQIPDKMMKTDPIFLNTLNLNYILEQDNYISLGAGVTFEEFKNSDVLQKYFPSLSEQFNLVASLPIRNSATIGGNIINGSPIADVTIILLALNAEVILNNSGKKRSVDLNKLYTGYKEIDKKENEFIESVRFRIPRNNYLLNFEKVSKRTHLDIASVNTAMLIRVNNNIIEDVSISGGGVSPIPLYLKQTSKYLKQKELNPELLKQALEIIDNEISPISDVRGSADYKRLLLKQLVKAHFIKLFHKQFSFESVL